MKSKEIKRSAFSKNIIKYRKARGFTQEKLAELSGLSKRMIAYYETNISNPPLNNILALSRALKVPIQKLIGNSQSDAVDLFEDIDMRTLKKIMLIKELPKKDRMTIYNMIDSMIEKNKHKS